MVSLPEGTRTAWADTWCTYMSRITAGDRGALGELYDESSPLIYRMARRMLGDGGDAEEVVLDAYLKLWKAAGRFNAARGSVKTWLLTIVRRGAIDRLRARRNEVALEPDYQPMWIDPMANPEAEYLSSERAKAVRRAMSELPEKTRQALELAYFGGLTQVEIAVSLGEPLGTVKTRVRAGLRQLRVSLAAQGEAE